MEIKYCSNQGINYIVLVREIKLLANHLFNIFQLSKLNFDKLNLNPKKVVKPQ